MKKINTRLKKRVIKANKKKVSKPVVYFINEIPIQEGDYFYATYDGIKILGKVHIDKNNELCLLQNQLDIDYQPETYGFNFCIRIEGISNKFTNWKISDFEIITKLQFKRLSKILDIGKIGDYIVKRSGDSFVFGCGEVTIPCEIAQAFVKAVGKLNTYEMNILHHVFEYDYINTGDLDEFIEIYNKLGNKDYKIVYDVYVNYIGSHVSDFDLEDDWGVISKLSCK